MIQDIHKDFLDRSIEILKKDSRILGVTAGGSYITQTMDEYSDLDLVIAIAKNHYQEIMNERKAIAEKLGRLLSAFTGEHVGEPRLLICLYGPELLHVDFKFVSIDGISNRVEDSVIIWERDNCITEAFKTEAAVFPRPSIQWIEDRFWVWIHYAATKLGRGEIFETIQFTSFLREVVFGPLMLMKKEELPRGLRRIESDAPENLPLLKEMLPEYSPESCVHALKVMIETYQELREHFVTEDFIKHSEAETLAIEYFTKVSN